MPVETFKPLSIFVEMENNTDRYPELLEPDQIEKVLEFFLKSDDANKFDKIEYENCTFVNFQGLFQGLTEGILYHPNGPDEITSIVLYPYLHELILGQGMDEGRI